MSQTVRILYRDKTGAAKQRTMRSLSVRFAPADAGEDPQHVIVYTDATSGQWGHIPMANLIAWGDRAVERVLALQPLSAAAPDGPWRTVESGRHPGEEHLVGAKDRVLMGHGDRTSIAYLKAAGEFCRNLFPSENLK